MKLQRNVKPEPTSDAAVVDNFPPGNETIISDAKRGKSCTTIRYRLEEKNTPESSVSNRPVGVTVVVLFISRPKAKTCGSRKSFIIDRAKGGWEGWL